MSIKNILPKSVRKKLYFYKMLLTKDNDFIEGEVLKTRNWNLKLDVDEQYKTSFINSALKGDIDFKINNNYKNVLLCAQPKSASLYINQLIASSFDFKNFQIGFSEKSGEVYYPRLLSAIFSKKNTISHCHAKATPEILQIVENLDLKIIVLSRNLLDSLISRKDMLVKDAWANDILSKKAIEEFLASDDNSQLDAVIELFANEYINFYAGWKMQLKNSIFTPLFITYEELITSEIDLLKKLGDFLSEPINIEKTKKISTKIKKTGGINFNKGVAGRGKTLFNENHIQKLKNKAILLGCDDSNFLGFDL